MLRGTFLLLWIFFILGIKADDEEVTTAEAVVPQKLASEKGFLAADEDGDAELADFLERTMGFMRSAMSLIVPPLELVVFPVLEDSLEDEEDDAGASLAEAHAAQAAKAHAAAATDAYGGPVPGIFDFLQSAIDAMLLGAAEDLPPFGALSGSGENAKVVPGGLRGSFVMAHTEPDGFLTVDRMVLWGDDFDDCDEAAENDAATATVNAPAIPVAGHTLHFS